MNNLFRQLDSLLCENYPPDEPGAAVLVQKEGHTLLRKGYGMANLELSVRVEPHMVFRLGSITKQFTAAAILMLVEQGKLDLQEDIRRFLQDYPTHGAHITVEHLLTHTSGIPSYTGLPEWVHLWRTDLSPADLMDLFKDKPLEFQPGERYSYNNSGYILLGAIIEKLSGLSYAEFIQNHIFEPLGMGNSRYDDTARIIPGRASGYTRGPQGILNAPYLSMTQPYAAGGLLSTVDDLALWDAGLVSNRLLRPETLQKAFQPYTLADGRNSGYGFGWFISHYEDWQVLEHDGSINGFSAQITRIPSERLLVVILSNQEVPKTPIGLAALGLAACILGKPYQEPDSIELSEAALDSYCGVYQIDGQELHVILREGNRLYSLRSGEPRQEILPIGPDRFLIKGSLSQVIFLRAGTGQIQELELIPRLGPVEPAQRTEKIPPQQRPAIALDPSILDCYTGFYEIGPGLHLLITQSEGKLFIQLPGNDKRIELFAETPSRLFLRQLDICCEVQFDELGRSTGLIALQAGKEYPCKKL